MNTDPPENVEPIYHPLWKEAVEILERAECHCEDKKLPVVASVLSAESAKK